MCLNGFLLISNTLKSKFQNMSFLIKDLSFGESFELVRGVYPHLNKTAAG